MKTTNDTATILTEANPSRTIAKVELYNICEGSRVVANGFYVGRYTLSGRRVATMKDFGRDEAGARAYADLWGTY